jgi:3-deoxy-D-manno-octulosonic-acid transferase
MLRRAIYFGAVVPLMHGMAWALAWTMPKLKASLVQRQGVWTRLERLSARRDPAQPLLWFHAASAGEFLQLEPLMRRMRERGQIAVTVTSVSGLRWLERVAPWPETVWCDLLPIEGWGTPRRLFDALRPTALVYAQSDLWPGLVWEASARGIPQALMVARLNTRSSRVTSPLLRWFYRDMYARLGLILAAHDDDAAALRRLVPQHAALSVGGDPGLETVLRRLEEAAPVAYPPPTEASPVLVSGSTWPPDEAVLRGAFDTVRAQLPGLRLVIAPHEPTEEHLVALESAWADLGTTRLSKWEQAPDATAPRVLLVDRVGRLAGLYRLGTVAYVGGAFTTGVHNVAEPAAAALPVCFGPRHHNSAAALTLLEAELAFAVNDAATLAATLLALLKTPGRCATVGRQARSRIESLATAAPRCWDALVAHVPALQARDRHA